MIDSSFVCFVTLFTEKYFLMVPGVRNVVLQALLVTQITDDIRVTSCDVIVSALWS